MSKYCPEQNRRVLYLDCLECETKVCKTASPKEEKVKNDVSSAAKQKKKKEIN